MAEENSSILHVGDRFSFGRYVCSASDDIPAPIEWEVLNVSGVSALAISVSALETMPYHASDSPVIPPWRNCTLRSWLNSDFLQKAFSEEERAMILSTELDDATYDNKKSLFRDNEVTDRVFLLSDSEYSLYYGVIRNEWKEYKVTRTMAGFTDHALAAYEKTEHADRSAPKTPDGKIPAPWWLRSTHAEKGSGIEISFVTASGSRYTTGRRWIRSMGVRPVIRLDLSREDTRPVISPYVPSPARSPIFLGADINAVRMLEVPFPRHDWFNRFQVLWDRFVTDEDGSRYRCAVSFSSAYDFSEGFNIFLVPENYDFSGEVTDEYAYGAWPRMNDLQWESGNGFKVCVRVNPQTNSIVWQVNNELWHWEPPYTHGSEATADYFTHSLPEDFKLSDMREDEKKRLHFVPEREYAWDADLNLFVWQIDGTEYFSYPNTVWPRQDSCDLCFDRDRGPRNLYVPPWTKTLNSYPGCWGEEGCNVEADTLLLPEGLEAIGEAALYHFDRIHRLVIPASVIKADQAILWEADVDEVLILGDPARLLNWSESAFYGSYLEGAYMILLRRLAEGLPLPNKTEEGILLKPC